MTTLAPKRPAPKEGLGSGGKDKIIYLTDPLDGRPILLARSMPKRDLVVIQADELEEEITEEDSLQTTNVRGILAYLTRAVDYAREWDLDGIWVCTCIGGGIRPLKYIEVQGSQGQQ